jgi:Cellulose synthase subunit D
MQNLDSYFRSQQIPLQWSPILRAMAEELVANADTQALHQLFFNIGSRLAGSVKSQFADQNTLTDLNESLNSLWASMSWGFVELRETSTAIEIEHRFAPLAEAFGDDMLTWSVGLLEGFYQAVFRSFGASDKMATKYLLEKSDALNLHLRLAP